MHEHRPIQAFFPLAVGGGFVCDQTRRDDSARFCGGRYPLLADALEVKV